MAILLYYSSFFKKHYGYSIELNSGENQPFYGSLQDKNAFTDILKKISKIQKNAASQSFVVLKEK